MPVSSSYSPSNAVPSTMISVDWRKFSGAVESTLWGSKGSGVGVGSGSSVTSGPGLSSSGVSVFSITPPLSDGGGVGSVAGFVSARLRATLRPTMTQSITTSTTMSTV